MPFPLKTVFTERALPAVRAALLNDIQDGIIESQRAPWVTALPNALTGGPGGGPLVDGQECYFLTNAVSGAGWHLKYNASETGNSKWYCIGGANLYKMASGGNIQSTGETVNNGAGYVAVTNGGIALPTLNIPLRGDYEITLSAYLRHGAAGGSVWFSYALPDGTAAADADALYVTMAASNQPDLQYSRLTEKTLTAGTLGGRMKATGASSVGLTIYPAIFARPVRVG